MPSPIADRVRAFKREDANTGGQAGQSRPYPVALDPNEDALDAAGVYFQQPNPPSNDEQVSIWREGGEMHFRDATMGPGVSFTLTQLASKTHTSDGEHGVRGGGNLHALATGTTHGFMSSTDKKRLEDLWDGSAGLYLPLTGGTLTGNLAVSGSDVMIDSGKSLRLFGSSQYYRIGRNLRVDDSLPLPQMLTGPTLDIIGVAGTTTNGITLGSGTQVPAVEIGPASVFFRTRIGIGVIPTTALDVSGSANITGAATVGSNLTVGSSSSHNIRIMGGSLINRVPASTGGWARFNTWESADGSQNWLRWGLYGGGDTPNYGFVGWGDNAWTSGSYLRFYPDGRLWATVNELELGTTSTNSFSVGAEDALTGTGADTYLRHAGGSQRQEVRLLDGGSSSVTGFAVRVSGNSGSTWSEVLKATGDAFEYKGGVVWHVGNFDPASKADVSHNHTIGQVSGLLTALDGKADVSHTHTIGQVSGLTTALNGKANVSHTHSFADVPGLIERLDPLTTRFWTADLGGVSQTTPFDLTDYFDELAITNRETVRLRLFTLGIGSRTGASYLVWANNSGIWQIRKIAEHQHTDGPVIEHDAVNNKVVLRTSGATARTIRIYGETIQGGTGRVEYQVWGADSIWVREGSTAIYGQGAVQVSGGTVLFGSSGDTELDRSGAGTLTLKDQLVIGTGAGLGSLDVRGSVQAEGSVISDDVVRGNHVVADTSFTLPHVSTPPAGAGPQASLLYDSTNKKLYIGTGTAWEEVGGGSSGYTLPAASTTVRGGIKVGNNLVITSTDVLSVKPELSGITKITLVDGSESVDIAAEDLVGAGRLLVSTGARFQGLLSANSLNVQGNVTIGGQSTVSGNIIMSSADIVFASGGLSAPSHTSGYLGMPTNSGVPAARPYTLAGHVVFDSTNKKLYIAESPTSFTEVGSYSFLKLSGGDMDGPISFNVDEGIVFETGAVSGKKLYGGANGVILENNFEVEGRLTAGSVVIPNISGTPSAVDPAGSALWSTTTNLLYMRTGSSWVAQVPATRTITTTASSGLTGGGALSANRSLAVNFAGSGTANTVARSDHNHDGTYSPTNHNHDGRYMLAGSVDTEFSRAQTVFSINPPSPDGFRWEFANDPDEFMSSELFRFKANLEGASVVRLSAYIDSDPWNEAVLAVEVSDDGGWNWYSLSANPMFGYSGPDVWLEVGGASAESQWMGGSDNLLSSGWQEVDGTFSHGEVWLRLIAYQTTGGGSGTADVVLGSVKLEVAYRHPEK